MESLLFVKLFVSVILVLTLSAVAEHISPRAAGLLSGNAGGVQYRAAGRHRKNDQY
jgi:hypothetical protein